MAIDLGSPTTWRWGSGVAYLRFRIVFTLISIHCFAPFNWCQLPHSAMLRHTTKSVVQTGQKAATSCRSIATSSSHTLHHNAEVSSSDTPSSSAVLLLRRKAQARIRSIDAAQQPHYAFQQRPQPPPIPQMNQDTAAPTLLDTFSRKHTYLRLSLTEKCSFRCVYCMPAEGVPLTQDAHLLSTSEVKKIAKAFVEMGVTKVRLTGGEPLLRKDVVEIVRYLRHDLGVKEIGITTNGLILNRMLDPLIEAGLTHLNISIDSLQPERFASLSRMPAKTLGKVLRVIDQSLQCRSQQLQSPSTSSSPLKVKLNVVVMKGMNEDEVCDFVEFTKYRDLDVRFIEYMPFLSNSWSTSSLLPSAQLLANVHERYGPDRVLRSHDASNDTTRHYAVSGHQGRFGFISSMTDHFCGSCNRVRVLADGAMKVCLFGSGKGEVSLRDALRSQPLQEDDEGAHLKHLISAALDRKHFKHAGMKDPKAIWEAAESEGESQGREMSRIGG